MTSGVTHSVIYLTFMVVAVEFSQEEWECLNPGQQELQPGIIALNSGGKNTDLENCGHHPVLVN